jgi:hypothetical protein
MTTDYKVRITGPNGSIIFEASSNLSESRSATYSNFDIIHMPSTLHSYKNTASRKWTIGGKLISRTASEAAKNVRNLDLARSWLLPDFGTSGATPPILKIYAYNNKNLSGRQVILVAYDWTFTEEVDYITTAGQPMPVIGQLNLTLDEIYSAEQITAGAWKINLSNDVNVDSLGGGFEASSTTDTLIPGGLMQQLGSPNIQLPAGVQTIANKLQDKAQSLTPNILGSIAGTLTRTLGSNLLNSPQVQAVVGKIPGFAQNVFVAGARALVGDLSKAATIRVTEATVPKPPADPFQTGTAFAGPDLPPPTNIG